MSYAIPNNIPYPTIGSESVFSSVIVQTSTTYHETTVTTTAPKESAVVKPPSSNVNMEELDIANETREHHRQLGNSAMTGRLLFELFDTAKAARTELCYTALHSAVKDLVPSKDLKVDPDNTDIKVYVLPGSMNHSPSLKACPSSTCQYC